MEVIQSKGSVVIVTPLYYTLPPTQSSKSRSGPLNAKQRKSIFAVPDSLEGKVTTNHHDVHVFTLDPLCRWEWEHAMWGVRG